MISTVAGRSEDDRKKIWKVINDLKTIGIKKTLENLTSRWFTDEFISKNPDLVSRRLNQVIETDKDVFINVFKIYAETEMINWLNEIKKPCLLITGENDGGCSPAHNKKMSNEIENSKLVIISKVKHSLLIETPDLIADNLLSFLN
jgi:pimeloyl-ACP methyl ester carboxylesterase